MKIEKDLFEYLVKIRRKIHENPEINFNLGNTRKITKEGLEKEHIVYIEEAGSILAEIEGESDKNILFRADMDALPMPELTDLKFKSKNNNAHCCGHDIHVTSLLGLLKYIKRNKVKGTVYALFQADEEGGNGAKSVVESGLLDRYCFDKLFALHVDAKLPYKKVSYGKGQTFASNSNFNIKIIGKSSHGARAYEGIDPINIGLKLCEMFYSVLYRECNVFDHNIFSITSFNSGYSYNIVPNEANILATLRCYDLNSKQYIIKRFQDMVISFEKLYNIKIEFKIDKQIPSVVADLEFIEDILKSITNFEKNIYIKSITDKPALKLGSEDFAFLSEKIKKSAYFFIGAGPSENESYAVGQHNSKVIFNERAILVALELLITIANKYLS